MYNVGIVSLYLSIHKKSQTRVNCQCETVRVPHSEKKENRSLICFIENAEILSSVLNNSYIFMD